MPWLNTDGLSTSRQSSPTATDVTVIGGGLAGKAASTHLAKAGLRVICIEPNEPGRPPLGESLDWSAPELLKALGLPMADLIEAEMATWKRHVSLKMRDGCSANYDPSPWLAEAPFHIELRTLHVDRGRLDQELMQIAMDSGVAVVRDKVVRVIRSGKYVSAVCTASGAQFSSPWYIDASGLAARILAREFNLPTIQQGPAKVAIWTYFAVLEAVEGTTLYMDPQPSEYLDWLWEIPINPQTASVGYVTTGAAIKSKREQGLSVDSILREQLARFPRFASLMQNGNLGAVSVTSFRSRIHRHVAGPNWLIAGEAASMVDPMTANGLTAALRHAAEAAALILRFHQQNHLPLRARLAYSSRIVEMASFFNSGIERIVYEPAVRSRIGLERSGTVYTSPAWTLNLLYSRLKPRGLISTGLFGLLLKLFRASAWVLYQICKRRTYSAEVTG
jgi:menaquinone-9 beta-reductase